MPTATHEYTMTELQNLYLEVHPEASRSKARREAEKEARRHKPSPYHLLGLHDLHDPTPADAIRNITRNDLAAARRLGLA